MGLFRADSEDAATRFADEVEAVRSGYILARDSTAYGRWRRDIDRQTGRRPEGKNLAQLARDFGAQGKLEFRA